MGGRVGKKVAGGGIGERIFADVEQMTADGNMKRLAAFKAIAERTGAQAGTVAANYYRVARKRGATLRPRRSAGDAAGSTKRALAGVLAALQKLGTVLDAQERELATLRKENRRFDELRRLLKS
ncbi:hypothetical protein KF840_19295 [bacterium]|nr:hypothetical protein [bacterium]